MQPICTQNYDPKTRKTVLWDRRQYNTISLSADDPEWWQQQGANVIPLDGGRGSAWRVQTDEHDWVLRHYRRGGLAAKMSVDRYWGRNTERTRAWREWYVLSRLRQLQMPAPVPVAAFTQQFGLRYRAALITEMLEDTQTFGVMLRQYAVGLATWKAVGECIARFHLVGLWHADLNVDNILLDAHGEVFLIDFDRARFRKIAKGWRQSNLQRLRRSVQKISHQENSNDLGVVRDEGIAQAVQGELLNGSETQWQALQQAYQQTFLEASQPS